MKKKYILKRGKLIDTTMTGEVPRGVFTHRNITDNIAEQLVKNNPGYLQMFESYPKRSTAGTVKGKAKVGVLVPTRGNRPQFLNRAKQMIAAQTYNPYQIEIVDDEPLNEACDITYRYRMGCRRLFGAGCNLVVFWEDDDWYSPEYIAHMVAGWENAGRPAIFGIASTIYYHIIIGQWTKFTHPGRASMMNTMVTRAVLDIAWCADDYPYCDLHLWKSLEGKAVNMAKILSVGIKHGFGAVGGGGHQQNWGRYKNNDSTGQQLREWLGDDAEFYQGMYVLNKVKIKKQAYEKEPLISIVTRRHGNKRPKAFAENQKSLQIQTLKSIEQIFIIDNQGLGLPFANKTLAYIGGEVAGRYVMVLDDDDFLKKKNAIQNLAKVIEEQNEPDIIFLYMNILNGRNNNTYPTSDVWGDKPIAGKIGMTCFIVKREVYLKHQHNFDAPRMGDFYFINAAFNDKSLTHYWHPEVIAKTTLVSRGGVEQ